jgi:3',5'-cyclic AMP phosphodiesterase CpdA
MKRVAVLFGMAVVLLVTTAGCIDVWNRLTWVEQDLDRLTPYAATESYAELAQRVQARETNPGEFRFVVLGDTRSNKQAATDVLSQAATEAPAFILSTGDLVRRGTVDEYIAHHMPLVELVAPIPLIPVPGNHEEGPNVDFATFKAIYGDERFSFDVGNCRFVGVNNGDRDGMSTQDIQYIDEQLSQPGAKYRFVMFHIPPAYMEKYAENGEGRGFRRNAERLEEVMLRHNVDHVFLGHIHGYASEVVDGLRYTITGGGGAPLATTLGEEGNVYNYIVVHVTADGLRYEVVRLLEGEWRRDQIP